MDLVSRMIWDLGLGVSLNPLGFRVSGVRRSWAGGLVLGITGVAIILGPKQLPILWFHIPCKSIWYLK